MKIRYVLAAVAVTTTVALAGCDSYNDSRGKGDAPVSEYDDSPAHVINFPDGFMNVAVKCYGTNGVYAHTRAAAPVVVVSDPMCSTEVP